MACLDCYPITRTVALVTMLIVACAPSNSQVHEIDPARGADPTVDYEALAEIGPWDDRNYALTADDLKLLASNERELQEPLPVFFRVLMRRANPKLPRTGPAQYPRSALPGFLQTCGGFLIDGKYYRNVTFVDGRFEVVRGSPDNEGVQATPKPECELRSIADVKEKNNEGQ